MRRPIRRIKPRINEFVGLVFVENSYEARNIRAQPRVYLAII